MNESGRDTSEPENTKSRGQHDLDFGVRVGAVVELGGKLLIAGHEKPGEGRYWVLPGGRLEPGETVPECASRELAEETGLAGEFAGVLYVSEFLREGRHTVDITARVEVAPETDAALGSDPETPPEAAPTLVELAWVTPAELSGMDLRPGWIRDRLVRDASRGWPGDAVYLEGGNG